MGLHSTAYRAPHSVLVLPVIPIDHTARSPRTSVLIVADVRLYREGLAAALSACSWITVAGTCAAGAGAREMVLRLRPDVVLVDVATQESLEIIRDLHAEAQRSKVLAFAVEEVAPDIIECAKAGAAGYVTVEASIDDLVNAIERIGREELVCSPRIAAQLFGCISTRSEQPDIDPKALTSRERQVLDCIRQGKSNKEIARALHIAEPTVKNHVHHLLAKLDVTTRAQAAMRASQPSGRRRPFGASAAP